jgi:RNA polymerase sigma factor (sigma-70 family)
MVLAAEATGSIAGVQVIPGFSKFRCMTETPDDDLVLACRDGDRRAFNELVRRYQKRVFHVVLGLVRNSDDALDITQDVFIRAWKGIDRFKGQAKVFTWLYRIAVNLSLNHLRSAWFRSFLPAGDQHEQISSGEVDAHAKLEQDEASRAVSTAIDALPPKQRAVFVLRYYEEMPYEEIAGILKTSVGGLKANYHHAVKKIEEHVRHALS